MKVVLDTNVLISALISPHNPLTSSFNHGSPETLSFSPQRISSKKFGESRVMPICSPFCNHTELECSSIVCVVWQRLFALNR